MLMKVQTIYCLAFLLFSSFLYSQKQVSGKVIDEDGLPLPSATVNIKGTDKGTATDFDGNYSLEVSRGDVLVFSYVGFIPKEVTVNDQTEINVTLKSNVDELEEVVVVGYGTQKKINLTGAVETVKFDEEVNQPVTNSGQLLYGRFSGVQLTQTSGSPGADASSVVIRGVGTFGARNPLVVIDDIQYDGLAAFNNLAPQDIESITVLKDASATAIYGNRAGNGVIVVRTRRGVEGKMLINYNGYYGVQDVTVKPEFLGALDYANLMNEKYRNEDGVNFEPRYFPDQLQAIADGSLPDQYSDTNWADEVLQTAQIQNHNLSFSGGSKKTTYRASLGFMTQDAVVKSKFRSNRYNLSFNINSQVKDWLRLSLVNNSFWRHNEGPTGGQSAFDGDNGIIYQFQRAAPTIPLFYSNGQYGVVDGAWIDQNNPSFQTTNPLRRGFLGNFVQDNINTSTRLGFTVNLTKKLTFESSGSINLIFNNQSDYTPRQLLNDFEGVPVINVEQNTLRNAANLNYLLLNENIVRYNDTFKDKHNFGALLGHAVSYQRSDGFNGQLSGFPTDNYEEFNAGGLDDPAVAGSAFEDAYQSFFTRINYNYDEKYLFEVNFRVDGSPKFGDGNRIGYFPSASAGWLLSKESFFDDINFVENLKIRTSWGITGNDRIGRNIWEQTYNPNLDYVLGTDAQSVVGLGITSIANPNIRWEESSQLDIGLDASLFKNKLEIIIDYFNRQTSDLLYENFPVPNTLGVTTLGALNTADMVNEGIELGVNYRGKIGEEVKFSVGTNTTYFLQNAEVSSLGTGTETITATSIVTEGEAFQSYYGYQAIGIFQDFDEIANAPTQFGSNLTSPGDIRYEDVNNDGVVDEDDRTIIGNPNPDWLVNFNATAEYKNFDVNFLFQGVAGVDRLLMGNGNLPMPDNRSNVLEYWINRWTPENPSTSLPRIGGINNDIVSSFYVQDASFLRLKNFEIGYSLPKTFLDKANIDKFRIFVGGQNLLTFTGLEFFDPEGGNGRFSNRNPPLFRTLTFGLNIKI
jgi:TonB-linked SusC/RagA family outer membrane protein